MSKSIEGMKENMDNWVKHAKHLGYFDKTRTHESPISLLEDKAFNEKSY